MWKVGGIKIDRQGNQWKMEIFYFLARNLETERDIGMGQKGKIMAIHRGPNAFLVKIGYGVVLLCFGCSNLVEGDQMQSVSKNKWCHKKALPQFSKYLFHNL